MYDDKEYQAIREYMGRATSGLGDIKNLTWRFLVSNAAITAFIISYKNNVGGAEGIVLLSVMILSAGSIFIAIHSFVKLKERRMELRELYKTFKFLEDVRPDYKEEVGKHDSGDYFFLAAGVVLPVLLFLILYRIMSFGVLANTSVSPPFWAGKPGLCIVIVVCLVVLGGALCAALLWARSVGKKREELLRQRKELVRQ